MTLRTQSIIGVCIALIVLVCPLALVSRHIMLDSYLSLEKRQMREDIARIQDSLAARVSGVGTIAGSYSRSDDVRRFLEDRGHGLAPGDTLSLLRINIVAVVNENGQIEEIQTAGMTTKNPALVPANLKPHLSPEGPLLQRAASRDGRSGIVVFPEGPLIVASAPIRNDGHGGSHRTLVIGRFLDQEEIRHLRLTTRLPVEVRPLPVPGTSWLTGDAEVTVRFPTDTLVEGNAVVKDIYSHTALLLSVTLPRETYLHGREVTHSLLASIFSTSILFALIILAVLERTVLSRVSSLSENINRITDGAVGTSRIPVEEADELASLRRAINRMVARQQQSQAQLELQQEHLDRLAHYDSLTGLPNRLLFQECLHHAVMKAHRSDGMVALLFLDLDRFKNINDNLGHEMGDRLLKDVARRLMLCVRGSETVARIGGDEFVVTLDNATSDDAATVAERILTTLSQPFVMDHHELYIGTSIGISLYPNDGTSVEELTRHADAAMYLAKERGRGNYQFYSEELNERVRRQLAVETCLRHALERKELDIVYQPRKNIMGGKITGVEALIRWQSPEIGEVDPAVLISAADETGLIVPIGEWVLRSACEQGSRWFRDGYDLRVAVNLSKRQFRTGNIRELVGRILAETCFPAELLELEIAEGVLLQDPTETAALMRKLKEMGIRLTLDDFGAEYSSLSHLKTFPFDLMKIPRTFVHGVPGDPVDSAIVIALISLAKNFGISAVPTGVETEEQLQFFAWYGCHQVQGLAVSPPLPADELTRLLTPSSSGEPTG